MALPARRLWLGTLHLGAVVVFVYLLREGLSYYLTPLIERPRHGGYWQLKPGGERGHLLGVVGSTMMVIMLGYSVRKRWRPMRRMGSLSNWLDLHIWLGVWGPALVILHSTFKVQGLVAVSFWSMIAVASSGVFGRFLYIQIPRARNGTELSLEQARRLDREMSARLVDDFGLDEATLEQLEALVARSGDPERSLIGVLVRQFWEPLVLRLRVRRLSRSASGDRAGIHHLRELLLRKAALQQRLLLWDRLKELFHYWHVLHKPFAVLMYLFMVIHVAVAWATGYAWGGA
jgi:hypothetical protein